jgi:hypothetical protein
MAVDLLPRPDVSAPPNVWVGELEVAPGPSSGVVLSYAPDTDAVYGDISFIDPATQKTRSFWVRQLPAAGLLPQRCS